ncbi:DMT family transporter, partial [Desulfovibrio sp. OttesenSCG-928-C14]|nr:DMT family transporter [Desulfovibrio sp. OttesenSCG-928-C14]
MRNAFIKLHISILLAGFTGIFGKLILLPEGPLVWYRMLFTSLLFIIFMCATGRMKKTPPLDVVKISGIGLLLGLHWVFFYGSIQYANISVGVVCFALAGFFTALFEPLFNRHRVSFREMFYSLLTIAGIYLIFHFDAHYRVGITLGVISAAIYALFTIANKRVGARYPSTTMLLYEMTGGCLLLTLLMPLYFQIFPEAPMLPGARDLIFLVLLATFCTILLYLLQIQALQKISAFTVNLSYNLEPVYSIVLAMLFFGEASEMTPAFFAGLFLICLSVALQTLHAVRAWKAVQPLTKGKP